MYVKRNSSAMSIRHFLNNDTAQNQAHMYTHARIQQAYTARAHFQRCGTIVEGALLTHTM
jgi:hypothetical protein